MDSPGGFGPLSVLVPHSGDAQGIRLRAGARRAGAALEVLFVLEGALSRLVLQAAPGGELWQHSCFEVFLRRAGMPAYVEFNFSLRGEWRAYSFASYRKGGPVDAADFTPAVSIDASEKRVQLEASLAPERFDLAGELEVGLSAVLERKDGDLSYWALRHAPGKPDFHHDDAFALRLHAFRD